jgi:Coenzyme PQQ synthesis protein D (PqqD)
MQRACLAAQPDGAPLRVASMTVAQHVVYRSFPTETVVLNLQTGKYYGLNATAGRMLEELERSGGVADAVAALAEHYRQPREIIERDVCQLCLSLLEHGLIEVGGDSAS